MKNRTLRVIIILVALLFINIEAAHAGLIQKIKVYILIEFPENQLLLITALCAIIGFFSYVIFTPVLIGNEKWAWLSYYSYSPQKHAFQNKRMTIKRISDILNKEDFTKQAHS